MFSRRDDLNYKGTTKFWLLFPILFFIPFAIALKWLPVFIEEQAFLGPTLEQKTQAMNLIISKLESEDKVDKAGLIKIFESQLSIDKSSNEFIHLAISLIDSFAGIFLGVMLIYFASVLFLYKALVKKET
jgi:hypothetical protein